MLEKAVADLKGLGMKEEVEPSITLRVAALIPESYVGDMTLRLSMYRRIANARGPEDLEDIGAEMADRFGSLPDEVRRLLEIMRLKIVARSLFITNISEGDSKIRLVFSKDTPVAPERILALQKTFHGIRFHKDGFELNLKGYSRDEAHRELYRAVSNLSE